METWPHDRANWLDRQFPSPPTINIVGSTVVAANSAVRISANKGVVYDTTDGSDPRNGHRLSNKATVIHPRNAPPLLSMKAPSRAMIPRDTTIDSTWFKPDFDDGSWPLGLTAFGYDDDHTYRRHIGSNLAAEVSGKHTTE